VEEVSFGENQSEMLEAVYDIKCNISGCLAPYAGFYFSKTDGRSASSFARELRADEIADCIRDTTRITFVEPNRAGCYHPWVHFADEFEPRIFSAYAYAEPKCYVPACHTNVVSLVKKGHRFNFDETKAAVDLHFKLEAHDEVNCGYQMAKFEFKDQHDKVRAIHELDMT